MSEQQQTTTTSATTLAPQPPSGDATLGHLVAFVNALLPVTGAGVFNYEAANETWKNVNFQLCDDMIHKDVRAARDAALIAACAAIGRAAVVFAPDALRQGAIGDARGGAETS